MMRDKILLLLGAALLPHAQALVTCNCPRFGSGAVFTSCHDPLNLAAVGNFIGYGPENSGYPSGVWPDASDVWSIDLCGAAQNKSHQPERLHGFNNMNSGYYRIETMHRSGMGGVGDNYTVVMQLEYGYWNGYYDGDGNYVDESKIQCAVGDVVSGLSRQAQMTVYLRQRYYVLIIEQTPQSGNVSNVDILITRVESTASPTKQPTLATGAPTTLAPAGAETPTTAAPVGVAPMTSGAGGGHAWSGWWMGMASMLVVMVV